jgi:DNA-binding response OmpR family regulator
MSTPERRILLVEDDEDVRQLNALTLRTLGGFAVTACGSAEEALDLARAAPPDLVLLDVGLPGLDGHAALQALRADPRTAAIPVLLLTAWVDEGQRVRGAQLGAVAVLAKTIDPAELCRRVRAALEGHPA